MLDEEVGSLMDESQLTPRSKAQLEISPV
jgi:hypothetical protein